MFIKQCTVKRKTHLLYFDGRIMKIINFFLRYTDHIHIEDIDFSRIHFSLF